MTQEQRIIALAQAIGGDMKAIRLSIGDLTALSTTAKSNLVLALNELHATVQPVTRAKYTKTKSILKHAKIALLAIVLTPSYQATLATGAAIGLVLWGAVK